MISSLALALILQQDKSGEPLILRAGETLEGKITDADPEIHTPTLDKSYTTAPTVGKVFSLEVDEPGAYTLELRSYFFDAYLVLRDEAGAILAEDDDGLLLTHARIVRALEPGRSYSLEACALHGARGPMELAFARGAPPPLGPERLRALELEELETQVGKVAALLPESPALLRALHELQERLRKHGKLERALSHCRRYLSLAEELHGSESKEAAHARSDLGSILMDAGDYATARPYFERALAIDERVLGPEHPDTAETLNNLALLLLNQGDYGAAQLHLERVLAIDEKTLGPEHRGTATSLNNLASVLQAQGDHAAARKYHERALAISERVLGSDHPDTATSLNNLALLLEAQGDHAAARPYLERALAIWEKVLGPEHPTTAKGLINLAGLLEAQGDHAAARRHYECALAIRERVLGPEHPDTASTLDSLAVLLWEQGDYAAARPCCERALAIHEKAFGPEHPRVATSLNNLALLLHAQGDYAAARPYCERALAIRERVLGPEHPDTAGSLDSLAFLLQEQGDYAAARPCFERALAIREKVLGPEHPGTATSLNNLAQLLKVQGDYAVARPYCERALAIRERVLGPAHPDTAFSLNNLAGLLHAQGDNAAARPLFERALAIREEALGPAHPDTAGSLDNLAAFLWAQGDNAAARPLFERALAIREEALGPAHPDTAVTLNNMAALLQAQGDNAAARPFLERALVIHEKVLGPEHPVTANLQLNLATLLADEGLTSEAQDHVRSALTSSLSHAGRVLWSLSEQERLLFLGEGELSLWLLLSLSRSSTRAEAEAFELSLAWRGLASRTMLASREQVRASVTTVETLRGVQTQLSKLLYATEIPDPKRHEREIRTLRERRNELEVELQRLAGPTIERAVTLAELRASLRNGSAFLDFLVHPLYEPAQREGDRLVRKGQRTPDHLSAWIVRPEEELVRLDLGPAAEIEDALKGWLGGVVSDRTLVASRGISAGEETTSASQDGEKLRALLWDPVARQLEGTEVVFVRPDSFLGTLPFEVIPLEGGKYLIEEKRFVYVQTPSDLIGADEGAVGPATLLAAGNVDYRSRGEAPNDPARIEPVVASVDLRGARQRGWPDLAFTGQETEAIGHLHETLFQQSSCLLLEGDSATEERLKQELPRFSVVHLATHGFFNPAGTVSMWDSAQEAAEKLELQGLETETRALVGQLPGLLTGLVCAGANEPAPAGRDDGLLTAEEVLWLDLSKVELVVLSACETALGERRAGEGMIGLRRAFGLAGAKTVISSLWSVKDRSTSELMQRFYENLWLKEQGRAEALRNAQLEMLARNRATEGDALPSTWGAFVLSGEWR